MSRKNKMPAKVRSFWCWGCRSFIVIDYKAGKYFCAKLQQDINPRDYMHCKLRFASFFDDEDDEPEAEQLDLGL